MERSVTIILTCLSRTLKLSLSVSPTVVNTNYQSKGPSYPRQFSFSGVLVYLD